MAKSATAAEADDPVLAREAELEGGRMPFLEHLGELRDRVRNAAIAFMAAFLICWGFAERIFAWLREPLFKIWAQHTGPNLKPGEFDWGSPRLIYTGITQPFWVNMSVALWAGIFLASPVVFYQLWRFIAPGLYKRERKIGVTFAVLSAVFFISGALFCFYLALPALFRYMLQYNSQDLQSLPNIQDYLDLTRDSMLAFGAIFEMPLLIYFLAMVGLVTHRSLWKFSRWFVVLAFIIGAILTPGPDVVSQFLMATPMIVLYNVSILFAWRVTRRRERADSEQRARENAAARPRTRAPSDSDTDGGSGGGGSDGSGGGGGASGGSAGSTSGGGTSSGNAGSTSGGGTSSGSAGSTSGAGTSSGSAGSTSGAGTSGGSAGSTSGAGTSSGSAGSTSGGGTSSGSAGSTSGAGTSGRDAGSASGGGASSGSAGSTSGGSPTGGTPGSTSGGGNDGNSSDGAW